MQEHKPCDKRRHAYDVRAPERPREGDPVRALILILLSSCLTIDGDPVGVAQEYTCVVINDCRDGEHAFKRTWCAASTEEVDALETAACPTGCYCEYYCETGDFELCTEDL